MSKKADNKMLVRALMAIAFVSTPTFGGVMAQNAKQLPPEVKARRAAAKKAAKNKVHTPLKAASNGVQLYGYVSMSDENNPGLYTFNTSNPSGISLVNGNVKSYGGATYAQGSFLTTYYSESDDGSNITMPIKLYDYNAADWSLNSEKRGFTFTSISSDLAFDPETQTYYGIFSDADYSGKFNTLGRFKYGTQEGYPYTLFDCDSIGQLPERFMAITFNRDGQLYGFGKSGKLYTVNKYNGKATVVGTTDVSVVPLYQSATCDYATGKIYWAAANDYFASDIYEVDPQTAQSSKIAGFGYDDGDTETCDYITGLYMKQDLTLNALPDSVTEMKVNLTSLTQGTVDFKMPTKDVKGTSLTGNLQYTVRINGEQAAEGTAAPGEAVSAPVTLANSGKTQFAVTAAIAANGEIPAAVSDLNRDSVWVGYGKPATPTNIKAEVKDNSVQLSWTAVEKTVNGGVFDKNNVKYIVKRSKKGDEANAVTVAENLAATSYTDVINSEEKATYIYNVAAVNGDMTGDYAESQEITYGSAISLPYTNNLDSEEKAKEFKIVDANNDGTTWTFDTYYEMMAYSANSVNAADDWLIAPAISAKKGAAYKFTFDALNSYPTERVALSVGSAPTAEAMTTQVIEPTDITYNPRRHTLSGTYLAKEDGKLYFGIHAMSDADLSTLYVGNVNIVEIASTAPAVPAEFTVTPGEKGASEATVAFNAPSTTLGGEPLTGNLKVNVCRDGVTLTTFTDVAPGKACSFKDEGVESAFHTYSAMAVNANGEEGMEVTKKVYVGTDAPGAVRNLRAYEDPEKEGLIHVTWDAPEGIHGGYINPEELTYYVSAGTDPDDKYLGNVNHYEEQLETGGKQVYTAYSVYATNIAGGGRDYWTTYSAIAGPSIIAPLVESFKGTTMKSGPWVTNPTKGTVGEAYCYAMTESPVTVAQDNDGGMQSFSAVALGKAVRSESPKVDISKMQNPVLNFWAYMNGQGDKLTVSVQKDYGEFVDALSISTDKYTEGWHRFSVDLAPYKDSKYVRIGFEGEAVKTLDNFLAYDNVAIVEKADNDMMARTFTAPEKLMSGNAAEMEFTYRNNSESAVSGSDYSLVLYKNDKEVSRMQGEDINGDAEKTVTFGDNITVLDPENTQYYAAVEYSADKFAANNASEKANVKVVYPNYPAATALTGAAEGNAVKLSWTAPDMSKVGMETTTDDFDSYKAFAITGYGDWTTYDCDQQNTIRITLSDSFEPLEYENAGKPMAFQVFNVEQAGIPFKSWDPHSGNQMLVSFACASNDGGETKKQNDDWLVSPELNGDAQTVIFYAKAGLASAVPEQMEVLYSTTDKAISSFQKIGETIDVNNVSGWDEYKVDVPEGTKYFAIRCVSNNKFALLVDDISYVAKGAVAEKLELKGYNVYRDFVKLNTKPVVGETYSDESVVNNTTYGYLVTAVYDKGESVPSNLAEVAYTSAIASVAAGNAAVAGAEGHILVVGAEGKNVRVYTVDGSLKTQFTANATERIAAQPGMYIVKIGNATYKVLVK